MGICDCSRDWAIGSPYTSAVEYAKSAGNGGGMARLRGRCSIEQLKYWAAPSAHHLQGRGRRASTQTSSSGLSDWQGKAASEQV